MARTHKPSAPKKSAFAVQSFTLTDDVVETLRQLSSDATDFLGRSISSSAIVRALVRQVNQQGPPAADALFILVEQEMKDGRLWGKKK
jgi:hypothetical protein